MLCDCTRTLGLLEWSVADCKACSAILYATHCSGLRAGHDQKGDQQDSKAHHREKKGDPALLVTWPSQRFR